jgi:hypothetical protein
MGKRLINFITRGCKSRLYHVKIPICIVDVTPPTVIPKGYITCACFCGYLNKSTEVPLSLFVLKTYGLMTWKTSAKDSLVLNFYSEWHSQMSLACSVLLFFSDDMKNKQCSASFGVFNSSHNGVLLFVSVSITFQAVFSTLLTMGYCYLYLFPWLSKRCFQLFSQWHRLESHGNRYKFDNTHISEHLVGLNLLYGPIPSVFL